MAGQAAQALEPAHIAPEHALLITRLLFEDAPRRAPAITARHAMPDDGSRIVDDLEPQPPEAEGKVNVLEVGSEVLGEAAGAEDRRAPIERGAGGGAENEFRRTAGVSRLV